MNASNGSEKPEAKKGKRAQRLPAELSRVNLDAAGIDVGSGSHFVAVPEGRWEQPVREFEAFTADLYRLADWLTECRVETVVMESTGVYWIPLFGVLEERGFEVMLVDPSRIKNVPGRKTDVQDCQWLQQLHTYGLLSGAFRPEGEIRRLRSYLRQRAMLVEYASHHIQHMQKALTQMNVKLQHVISNITGKTGMKIIEAIVRGERNPRKLAGLRDPRTRADEATIAKSLQGHWREEHIFELTQALELYRIYQHMQKALTQMNVKLQHVISNITGKTGMKIIEAIVRGERNPRKLAGLRDPRTRADEATIAKSLQGHWREEHIFELTQALELYRIYQDKIAECDREIEGQLEQFEDRSDGVPPAGNASKRGQGNAPRFDLRSHLYRMTGVDLTRIDGVDAFLPH